VSLPETIDDLVGTVLAGDMTALAPLADCLEEAGDPVRARNLRTRTKRWENAVRKHQAEMMTVWTALGEKHGFATLLTRTLLNAAPYEVLKWAWAVRGGRLPDAGLCEAEFPGEEAMTEAEWLACETTKPMMDYLLRRNDVGTTAGERMGYRASKRKLRLFVAAVTRKHIPRSYGDHADDELPLWRQAEAIAEGNVDYLSQKWWPTMPNLANACSHAAGFTSECHLLRDIIGNPFRRYAWSAIHDPAPSGHDLQFLHTGWLTPDVLNVAGAAYETRDWSGLPALADALEEAGCVGPRCAECHGSGTYTVQVRNAALSAANGYGTATTYSEWRGCRHCGGDHDRKGTGQTAHPLLAHLRGPGPHARGCWAIDCILGKE
jgi:hypothetical protein